MTNATSSPGLFPQKMGGAPHSFFKENALGTRLMTNDDDRLNLKSAEKSRELTCYAVYTWASGSDIWGKPIPRYDTSKLIVLYCIISYRIVSYRIVSYRIVLYPLINPSSGGALRDGSHPVSVYSSLWSALQ